MSRLTDRAKQFIEDEGAGSIAQIFNKSEQTVKQWLRTNRFPQEVYEYLDSFEQLGPPTETVPDTPEPNPREFTMSEVMDHLQNHADALNDLYTLVLPLVRVTPPQAATVPGHMPSSSRVVVRDNPDGSRPGLVMQDNQFGSMVRVSQPIGHTNAQAPVVTDAEPAPVYTEPRNPDPNHWTKPKQVFRPEGYRR